MIGYLRGKIISADERSVIIDVGGIGYRVFANTGTLGSLIGKETQYWTYLSVRENALDLFGFGSRDELAFFELLISVSGIGPKTALGILNTASLPNLRRAIKQGDVGHLTKVSGIGKKSAEKIVIELRDKLDIEDGSDDNLSGDLDALEALKSLGYDERTAREALKQVSGDDAGEKVKKALKILS